MINWIALDSPVQVEEIADQSRSKPCVIFKHSSSCGVSTFAQLKLEEDWAFSEEEVTTYLLDVIAHREIARRVADEFSVHHESPQLLLIRNGECTYEASHLDISVAELQECFHDTF